MNESITISKFNLDGGVGFSQCLPSERCPTGMQNQKTLKAGVVDLVIELDAANEPVKANAYQPDFSACSPYTTVSGACIGNFEFAGVPLTDLINKSPLIQERLKEYQDSQKARSEGQQGLLSSQRGDETSHGLSSNVNKDFFDPALILGLVGGAAFAAIQYLVSKAWSLRQKKPGEYKGSSKSSDTSAMLEAWQNPTTSQASYIAKEIERQLFSTKQKVGILIKEVEGLKTDLIDLSQKSNMPSVKAPSVVSRGSDISFSMQEPREYLPVLPTPLSIELIKQAVASWNYQAIGSYELDFVTETSESREGLTETKTFTIDGNQSEAASRGQSEFIAIGCQNTTYLIPNILQNAADPARTINRHLERIYKRGVGADLKILVQLATVRKSGNCFELVEMGQVS